VKGSRGSVRAAFTRRGRVALLASTAAGHGNRGLRPGRRTRRRGLVIAGTRVIGIRRGRVRFTGVAARGVIARPALLRRYLRLAGLR
jgi:hypothetical protein